MSAVNWNQQAVLFVAAKLHFFCSETESKSEVKRNRVEQSETVVSGVDRGGHHQQQLPSLVILVTRTRAFQPVWPSLHLLLADNLLPSRVSSVVLPL